MLDAPCGDFHWMKEIQLGDVEYIGVDIVSDAIEKAKKTYSTYLRTFRLIDIIEDELPRVDLIFCRDALVHFPYREVRLTLMNFKRSGSAYLLTTTFPRHVNTDVKYMSLWRPLNLEAAPFNFPKPLLILNENCPERDYVDKSLALWRTEDLPA